MSDLAVVAGAATAGSAIGLAVVAAAPRPGAAAARWLDRRRAPEPAPHRLPPLSATVLARLASGIQPDLERAGWKETPQRLVAGVLAAAGAAALVGTGVGVMIAGEGALVLGPVAAALPPLVAWRALLAAGRRRRERLRAELAPLLELLCLELGAGSSLTAAVESVVTKLQGDLADDLRPLLVGAQLSGSATLQERLDRYGTMHRLPAVKSLAALCGTSREYGSGAAQGARALAADLRRAQRRELIAESRRALNRVLLPSAAGILLPFMGVLLFPAISTLAHSLP